MLTEYYWISSASLHPPTSVARSAGFANVFAWLVPGVPLRSTPGFTLSPAPRALPMFLHGWFLGFRCAPPQALRCRPLRGLCQCFCMAGSWGSAALHPRLYAVARSAGFANVFAWLVPGVPLRSTPGFTLSPAPRALPMFLHGWFLGFRCAPPQALRCRPLRGLCQCFCMAGSWGSAALHPRLYAVARSAGFANVFAWLVPGVPLRSTPGFTLSPAPRALPMFLHGWFLGFRCAPPQALRCRPLRGLCQCFCMAGSWGSAALHPRLYAVARSAGFANVFAWLFPGVPLRSTPGFTLSPAPRVLQMFLHGWSWGSAALHPRLYAVTRSAGFANVFAGWSWGSTALHPRLYA